MADQLKSTHRLYSTFKNRFGHYHAGWRILIYLVLVIILFKLVDLLENSYLLIHGESLSDYALLFNRIVSNFFRCFPYLSRLLCY